MQMKESSFHCPYIHSSRMGSAFFSEFGDGAVGTRIGKCPDCRRPKFKATGKMGLEITVIDFSKLSGGITPWHTMLSCKPILKSV